MKEILIEKIIPERKKPLDRPMYFDDYADGYNTCREDVKRNIYKIDLQDNYVFELQKTIEHMKSENERVSEELIQQIYDDIPLGLQYKLLKIIDKLIK